MKVTALEEPIRARGRTIDTLLRLDFASLPTDCLPHRPDPDTLVALASSGVDMPADRGAVADLLARHNSAFGHDAGADLAKRLADPRAVAVVTGQQPWLYAGPCMLFAKIAGAALLARHLEERAGVPVVPVFWNHSEDHDVDEVNRFFTFADGEVAREGLDLSRHAGHPIETLQLNEADAELAGRWIPDELADLRPRSGERHATWASRVVQRLMPDLTVVHAEPMVLRPLLGDLFSELIRRGPELLQKVVKRSRSLEEAGFTPQVAASDASLLFALSFGGRSRVPVDPDPELAARASSEPGSFSCGVLSRAVAQQHVLPIVAHVNGPAENAYFAQMPDLFAALGRPMPAAVPRPTLTVVGPKESRAASRLGIALEALVGDPAAWPEPPATSDVAPLFTDADQRLRSVVDTLREGSGEEGLARAVDGFAKRVDDALTRLRKSFEKQREQAGDVGRRGRRRLAESLRPRGKPQERLLGPLALLRGNDPALIGDILSRIDPLDFRHHVVTLDDEDLAP